MENLSIKDYCFHCINYDKHYGVCTELHEILKLYPKKFIKKCNEKYYRDNNSDITIQKTTDNNTCAFCGKDLIKKTERDFVAGFNASETVANLGNFLTSQPWSCGKCGKTFCPKCCQSACNMTSGTFGGFSLNKSCPMCDRGMTPKKSNNSNRRGCLNT